jgi:hypothetical protein
LTDAILADNNGRQAFGSRRAELGSGRRLEVRDAEDLVSGLIFVGLGLGAVVIALGYPMGTAARMGPGYFPTVLGGLLAVIGLAIVVKSLGVSQPEERAGERQPGLGDALLRLLRPLVFVAGALVAFAFLLPRYGLVLAVIALVMISAFADHRPRLLRAIPLAAVMAALVVLVFVRGLGLPIRVWP